MSEEKKEKKKIFKRPPRLIEIKKKFGEYFLIGDNMVIDLLAANIIGNRMPSVHTPIWLMLVAPSSGGKTEYINLFHDLGHKDIALTYLMSDLTPNTLVSGMAKSMGTGADVRKNPSLIFALSSKVLVMKDFTTIMQKSNEARREILSQFREIYDGEFTKEFGTGKSPKWTGHVGMISAITPHGLDTMAESSGMGERFISYSVDQPNEDELSKLLKKTYSKDIKKVKKEAQAMMLDYVQYYVAKAEITTESFKISDDILDDLNSVARFATQARSPITTDFRTDEPIDIPVFEKFPRFLIQLQNIAKGFCVMNERIELTDSQRNALYKIALDSIPRKRRAVLQMMAGYQSVTTTGASAHLGPPTSVLRAWLSQLVALKLVVRLPKGGSGNEDSWMLSAYGRKMMDKFEDIKMQDVDLVSESQAQEETMSEKEIDKMKEDTERIKKEQGVRAIMEEEGVTIDEAQKKYGDGNRAFSDFI